METRPRCFGHHASTTDLWLFSVPAPTYTFGNFEKRLFEVSGHSLRTGGGYSYGCITESRITGASGFYSEPRATRARRFVKDIKKYSGMSNLIHNNWSCFPLVRVISFSHSHSYFGMEVRCYLQDRIPSRNFLLRKTFAHFVLISRLMSLTVGGTTAGRLMYCNSFPTR
jgi:hypothetical protein